MRVGMVVTDLDGTLLDSGGKLSSANRRTLLELGEVGVARVVATGRTLYSARRVLTPDMPIDYLAHSSGAGIFCWATQRELHAHRLDSSAAQLLMETLLERRLDFMLHRAIPNNHSFFAHRASAAENADFEKRVRLYAEHHCALPPAFVVREAMGHAIVIEPPGSVSCYGELCATLRGYQVIRSTSPLDGRSSWIEVYPAGVNKAGAATWIRQRLSRASELNIAIGNDYNDLDLLEWADQSFVVANAPEALRARFETVASNDASGFSEAVRCALARS